MVLKRKKRAPKSRPADKAGKVEKWGSFPGDVVLAPQAELPRQLTGSDRSAAKKTRVKELSWAQFDVLVQGLSRGIGRDFRCDAVVGVAHGGVFVGGAVASALAAEFFPVRISRRSRDKSNRPGPRLQGEMPKELKGKRVLIVDDVASSGDTLELATQLAKKVGAREVKTAALIVRDEGHRPDFFALAIEDLMVFPWDYEPVVEDGRFDVDPDKAGA